MPRFRPPSPALPLLLAALALAPATPAANDKSDSSSLITDAKGLTFSGYERAAAGRKRWTLTADTAKPADKAGKLWTIDKLTLRTFDGAGKAGITISAPAATFDQAARSAADAGPVSLTGDQIILSGKNWSWNALENHDNRVEIREAVRVTLAPKPGKGPKRSPVHIDADSLVAVTAAKGMTLTFAGHVRVRSGEVTLRADRLTTLVRSAGGDSPASPLATDNAAAVESITADGAVTITRRGGVITGDHAVMTPATGLYAVTGHARFTDLSDRRVSVSGSAMSYDSKSHRVTVSPGDDDRVHADLPTLDNRRDGEPADDDARTHASAKTLVILIAPDNNRLMLEGDVAIDDPQNTLRCGRLTVETPRRETEFVATAAPAQGVSRVLAEDAVVFTRDGRELHCDRAEILPPQHKAILTGSPRGDDPVHHAALEAAVMTLDTAARSLTAEASPARRVRVTLADRRPGATRPYAVESDLLLATRNDAGAVFEFEDKVTLDGPALSGSCDRLGIEVENQSGAAGRVRRIVASGTVRLTQAAYSAEAARAEILPGAILREISTKDDNGLDGKAPCFVTLESDLPAGVRTRVTLPAPSMPKLTAEGPLAVTDAQAPASGQLTLDADFQELVAGRDRIRTFSRGSVSVASPELNGRCAALEMRAIAAAGETAERDPKAKPKFEAEAIIARDGVDMRLGERRATADTLEILPMERRIALIGHPEVTGWPTPPGIGRKTIAWQPVAGPDGRAATRVRLADEPAAGMPEQIIRPRLTLPQEMSLDLGRSLRKSLDKKNP